MYSCTFLRDRNCRCTLDGGSYVRAVTLELARASKSFLLRPVYRGNGYLREVMCVRGKGAGDTVCQVFRSKNHNTLRSYENTNRHTRKQNQNKKPTMRRSNLEIRLYQLVKLLNSRLSPCARKSARYC